MSLIFLAGFHANAIRRATLSSSPAALSGYPALNLGRGLIVEPFRFGSQAANAYVEADLSFILNGGFESFGADGLPLNTAMLKRFWRLCIPEADDMGETAWFGEWILGPDETMTREQRWDWRVVYTQPQVRQATGTGQIYSTWLTDRPMPGLELEFMAESEAERDQVFRDVFQAADWGDEPLIIVPDDTKPLVVHGRVGNTWEYPNEFDDTFTYGLRIDPDPYPTDLIGG